MILEIFKDSIEYSYKKPKSVLKLGVLVILSVFIIPIFFLEGYCYKVTEIGLNGMINGEDPLPKFNDYENMLINGIKVAIVRFVYLLPGILVFLIPRSTPYGMTHLPSDISAILFEMGIVAITLVLWIVFYLFSKVAIPNMINNNGSLKSAFDFKEIISIIKSIGFLRYVKFYFGGIILAIGLITTIIFIIMLFGLVIAFFIRLLLNTGMLVDTVAVFLSFFIIPLLIVPFFLIFESRAIALMYNMRET